MQISYDGAFSAKTVTAKSPMIDALKGLKNTPKRHYVYYFKVNIANCNN